MIDWRGKIIALYLMFDKLIIFIHYRMWFSHTERQDVAFYTPRDTFRRPFSRLKVIFTYFW